MNLETEQTRPLTEKQRKVLMCRLLHIPVKTIARKMGCTKDGVAAHQRAGARNLGLGEKASMEEITKVMLGYSEDQIAA